MNHSVTSIWSRPEWREAPATRRSEAEMDQTERLPPPLVADGEACTEKRGAAARLAAVFRYGVLLAGAVAAGWLLSSHGEAIYASLTQLGWSALLYLGVTGTGHVIHTLGWQSTILQKPLPLGFWHLWAVRLSGEALNKVTPFASLGGEPLKAHLLTLHGVGGDKAFLSIVLSRYAHTLAQVAFVLTGVALAVSLRPHHSGTFAGFAIFPAIVLGVIVTATLADLGVRRLARSPAPSRIGGASTLALWKEAGNFFWQTPGALAVTLAWFFGGWCAGILELLVAARLLGLPLSVSDAIAFEGLLVSVNLATFFIPGNVGSQEGAFAFLAPLFGFSPAEGMALAVLRRLRDALWILLGLGYGALVRKPTSPSCS